VTARAVDAAPGESPETAITISTLTGFIKDVLEGSVPALWVRGEVTGFKVHSKGHWYFTLRDAASQLKCAVWASNTRGIPAPPDEGMQVTAYGRISVFAARADVQLSITRLEAAGDGLWRKAFEKSRARLDADGLLDPARKRPLPRYPRVIAVVTAADGAALHDIISVARRRDPTVNIVVVPAAVQGESAPTEIIAALRRVGKWRGADLVIVGRGGGSREDLRAFDDERVARAVAACPLPTISAVGHEVDVSLCDLVADLRAATPSAAAEAAVPVRAEVEADLARTARRLRSALANRAERARADFARHARELSIRARRVVELRRAWVASLSASLDALSPLKTLERGYAVARAPDGSPLSSVADFVVNAEFALVVRDGQVQARTLSTHSDPA
jgi:exodeoxyribonuclease VII large subunit